MNDRLTYTLVTLTPEAIDQEFTKIKHAFDLYIDQPLTQKNGIVCKNHAHITLKSAFYLKEGVAETKLIDSLSQLSFHSCEVNASKSDIFQTKKLGEVVVALVDDNPELIALHNSLETTLADFTERDQTREKHPFKPHLSVAYRVPKEQIELLQKEVNEHLLPINFPLTNVYLLREVEGVIGERTIIRHWNF